jgi:parallel beta-helix repeat protein
MSSRSANLATKMPAKETESAIMYCRNCGIQLSADDRFCSNCGAPTNGTASVSGSSTQSELEQERTDEPATGESIAVEPGSLESAAREAQAGDILRLKAGEHRLSDPLEIDKPLSLIGEGSGNTRVLCDGEAHVVKLVGDGPFALYDLSFEHLGSRGADVVEVSGGGISIRGCRFTGGVEEENISRGAGLILSNDTRGVVANCEAVQNESIGIAVSDWAEPTLEANTCQGNGLSGIVVSGQAQPTLETNTCEGNSSGGIGYLDSAAGTARHNTCRANDIFGIVLMQHAKPVLERNTCSDNGSDDPDAGSGYGVGVFGQAYPTLEANTCQGNTGVGIGYQYSAAGTARHNVCSANKSGIVVGNQAHPTLEANTCQENAYGIGYTDNAAGVARHNVCRLNREDDLYVGPSAHPMLEENRTGSPEPQTAQTGSQTERTLYEFPSVGVAMYDGQQNLLGNGPCTITDRRVMLESHRGTQQILLRDITGLKPEIGWVFHQVTINVGPGLTYELEGDDKNETRELYSRIQEAMRSQL